MQAKLGQVPSTCRKRKRELSGGAYIEYSGPPLAMFKLTRAMMLFHDAGVPGGAILRGMGIGGGWVGILLALLKYVGLVTVVC